MTHKVILPSKTIGVSLLLTMTLLLSFAHPTWVSIRSPSSGPSSNKEFSPDKLSEAVLVIEREIESGQVVAPRIAARMMYLPYLAGGIGVDLPFTDYPGLVRYCRSNDIDYVFLEYDRFWSRPFHERFKKQDTPDFELLYVGGTESGNTMELYRFVGESILKKSEALVVPLQSTASDIK